MPHSDSDHPGIRRVVDALAAAGLPGATAVRVLDAGVHTAAAAADALGVEVGAIANSLVFDADGEPLLALTSGAHRADPARLAALAGVARVGKAGPDFVREHTGQPIGGVAPLGHPRPIRAFVDRELRRHAVVWAGAGHPKAVFPTTFDELLAMTGGAPADVAAQPTPTPGPAPAEDRASVPAATPAEDRASVPAATPAEDRASVPEPAPAEDRASVPEPAPAADRASAP